MKKIFIFISVIFIFAPAAFGQSTVEATARIDRDNVKLGDIISYTISVKRQGDVSRSPEVVPPAFQGFRVTGSYSQNSMNIINGAASVITNLRFDLMCIKNGVVVIPPAKIKIFDPATNKVDEVLTKPVTVHVGPGKGTAAAPVATPEPTPTVEENIREIKLNVAMRFSDLIPYIILAVIFIAAGIFIWMKLFGKKAPVAVPQEEADYRKDALKKLRKAGEHLKRGDIKIFYYEMYEAVRYFLSMYLSSSFAELTTQEIVKKLGDLKLKDQKIIEISEFMNDCDIVKFADYRPQDKEVEEAYKKAEEIIEKT